MLPLLELLDNMARLVVGRVSHLAGAELVRTNTQLGFLGEAEAINRLIVCVCVYACLCGSGPSEFIDWFVC
jgi:hypothetical protein